MNALPLRLHARNVVFLAFLTLLVFATGVHAQTVRTGIVKLADANIQYFDRGKGEPIVLLPGGTLTVGYLDGLANALAKAGYRVRICATSWVAASAGTVKLDTPTAPI